MFSCYSVAAEVYVGEGTVSVKHLEGLQSCE